MSMQQRSTLVLNRQQRAGSRQQLQQQSQALQLVRPSPSPAAVLPSSSSRSQWYPGENTSRLPHSPQGVQDELGQQPAIQRLADHSSQQAYSWLRWLGSFVHAVVQRTQRLGPCPATCNAHSRLYCRRVPRMAPSACYAMLCHAMPCYAMLCYAYHSPGQTAHLC
jgi:hypothetical protein